MTEAILIKRIVGIMHICDKENNACSFLTWIQFSECTLRWKYTVPNFYITKHNHVYRYDAG